MQCHLSCNVYAMSMRVMRSKSKSSGKIYECHKFCIYLTKNYECMNEFCIVFTFLMHLCAQMPRTFICALMGECQILLFAHLPCVHIWPSENSWNFDSYFKYKSDFKTDKEIKENIKSILKRTICFCKKKITNTDKLLR